MLEMFCGALVMGVGVIVGAALTLSALSPKRGNGGTDDDGERAPVRKLSSNKRQEEQYDGSWSKAAPATELLPAASTPAPQPAWRNGR